MPIERSRSWNFSFDTSTVLLKFVACVAGFAGVASAGVLGPCWSGFDRMNMRSTLYILTKTTNHLRPHTPLGSQSKEHTSLVSRSSKFGPLRVKHPPFYQPASNMTAHAHMSSISTSMVRSTGLTPYSSDYNAHVTRTFVLSLLGSHATTFL